MPAHSRPLAPALALLFNALVWGLTWFPFKALEANGVHPLWGTFVVYVGAAGLLLAWQPAALAALVRHPALLLLALAAGLTNIGFNWAVTIGDVVRVVLLFYLMPVWSIGLAWWLLGERPSAAALARLLLALAGTALVLKEPGSPWPLPSSRADALALMGGCCFALTNVLLRRWGATPSSARALAMFGGGAVTAGIIAGVGLAAGLVPALPSPAASGPAWLGWAALLCAAMLAANMALQYGAARLPAQVTALIMLSEVIFASISAVLLGAATLTAATLAGGALIVLAALLAIPR